MQITDILASMGGLQSMAKELGITEGQAATGAAALAPAVLGGLKKQAQSSGGMEGLGGLLSKLGGGSMMDSVLSPEPTDVNTGNELLGSIFGSKDVSRTVAQSASQQSGLDAGVLKKMLPMLAMLVAGYMAKKGGGAAGASQQASTGAGGLGGMLGGVLGGLGGGAASAGSGGGGLGSMIDMNGDGNALDDIMRMAGKVMR